MASFETAYDHITQGRFPAAVREARRAAAALGPRWESRNSLAGSLIDAGAQSGKRSLVLEGIGLLMAVLPEVPPEAKGIVHYNLGNGYLAAADLRKGRSLSTRNSQTLALAVNSLAQAAELRPDLNDARTNLASALLQQGRSIEAIDLLTTMVAVAHPMPRLKRAYALEHVHFWMHPRAGVLDSALADAVAAQRHLENFPEYARACTEGVARYRALVKEAGPHGAAIDPLPGPLRWIWDSGLALNPCVRCRDTAPTAFDVFVLDGLLEGRRRRPSADEVAEIVSAWHRTFSAARWTAMSALEVEHPLPDDHVVVLPGGRNAPTNLKTGLLLQAAVGFHSVFDQIAFGLNAYLHLGHMSARVDFKNFWYPPKRKPAQQGVLVPSELHPTIRRKPLPPLSALYWLSRSLQDGDGLYHRLRDLRNRAEHHVTVTTSTQLSSKYFTVVDGAHLEADVLALGRLAKAAMWYAGATILAHERGRARRAMLQGLAVVRGERWVQRT